MCGVGADGDRDAAAADEADEAQVALLGEMGFSVDQCREALSPATRCA